MSAVPRLVDSLKDKNADVREAAAFAIGKIGPTAWDETFPALVKLLNNDPEPLVRRSAAFALGSLGRQAWPADEAGAGAVSSALDKALGDGEASVRQNAAWALGRIGPKNGQAVVPSLCKTLADADAQVRRETAAALGEFGQSARMAVPGLLTCFQKDTDTDVRKSALNALVNSVGPDDRGVASGLRSALRDPDPEVVRGAALALANIGGPEAQAAVPALCESLQDKEASTRRLAAAALAHLGTDASPSVASLTAALADHDPVVRRNAAVALGRIGAKPSKQRRRSARMLESQEPEEIRTYVAEALSHISPAVMPVVPTLLRVIKADSNWSVRQRAVWAVARLDNPIEAGIVPALTPILSETDPDTRLVRYDSAVILGILLGPKAPDKVLDVLQALLDDKQIMMYHGADTKVSSGGPELCAGEATITKNLTGDCRGLAAEAIFRIGPKANRPAILRSLKDAAQSPDSNVRESAQKALRKIQG